MEKIYSIEECGSFGGNNDSYIFERIFDTEENYKKECLDKSKYRNCTCHFDVKDISMYGLTYVKNLEIRSILDESKLKVVEFTEVTLHITPKAIFEEKVRKNIFMKPTIRYRVDEWEYNFVSRSVKINSTAIVHEDVVFNKVTIKE